MDIEINYDIFRERLNGLVASRGRSIKALSEDMSITAATLSRYLSGSRKPDLIYVIKMSRYFNVSIDWLLGINGDRYDMLPDEVQDIAFLYQLATPEDRKVIQTILERYDSAKDKL